MIHRIRTLSITAAVAALGPAIGCHKPVSWDYTGPRVYLIEGADAEESDALARIRDELRAHEINAEVFRPDNWLRIVVDIDAKPEEEVILVGHGHGAFLCTQVVRHYAQEHKTKFIEAVVTIDPYNKDWPHSAAERGDGDPRIQPTPIPIGHNALTVHDYEQANDGSDVWGTDLVSTRACNVTNNHPYYWYDHYWDGRPITGRTCGTDVTDRGVTHVTIDNEAALVERIVGLCRKAALSPYHYTPPEHHPDGQDVEDAPASDDETAG